MMEAFRDGGWGMYPTLIFGLVLVVAAMRYAARPRPQEVPLMVSLGMLTLFSGCLGFVTGITTTMRAVAQVPPEQHFIALIGLGESAQNLVLALVMCVLATLAAVVGAWRLSREAAAPARG
jgi:hypothetical protein